MLSGYNVTILAYGQTGSGKTYSMGTCYNGEGEMGIIPRAISDIFQKISVTDDKDFKVTASFIEVNLLMVELVEYSILMIYHPLDNTDGFQLYKEQLFDLLACSSKPRDQCVVDIREDSRGILIPGLIEREVSSTEDTYKALMMVSFFM